MYKLTVFALLLLSGAASAAAERFELTITAGKHDYVNVPVCVVLSLPAKLAAKGVPLLTEPNDHAPKTFQLTQTSLLHESTPAKDGTVLRELHFIVPALKAGESLKLKLVVSDEIKTSAPSFAWHEKDGNFTDLSFQDRPVLRYVHYPFDDSTKEKRERSFKVFHHLYDPTGQRLVTNDGPGSLYPHHRGIFFGFNKVTYGNGKKADVWHCTGDAHMTHEKTLLQEAGPVLARQRVEIAWHGEKKEVFAKEERELTVYNVPGGQLVEFASRVRTTDGPVKLDGDPQHAGFHFRAHSDAVKTQKETFFIRPDGVGKPGKEGTRNWDPKTHKGPVNLPWNAMNFVLGKQHFTVAYLDRPSNPKEARFSEREYGRIGSYFEFELTEKKPLVVNYRLWLQEGSMTPDQIAAKSTAFATPPEVTVKAPVSQPQQAKKIIIEPKKPMK